jgi:cell wall-associated NlpC family hydrolase
MDPAMPFPNERPKNLARATYLANYGDGWAEEFVSEELAVPATMALDWSKVQAFLQACRAAGVGYALGAKVPNDNSVPGRDFTSVDCSGFVRAAVHRATDPTVPFPDGSVVQQDWVRAQGFATGSIADGMLADGKVRIAFLNPQDSPNGVGHVVLVCNAFTAESHGGVGPDARPFNGTGWQAKAEVYLLTN